MFFHFCADGVPEFFHALVEGGGDGQDGDLFDLRFELLQVFLGDGLVHLVGDDEARFFHERGVWWRAVAKLRLPNPPRPPLHKTNCWPCVVRSATSSPLSSMALALLSNSASLLKSTSKAAGMPPEVRMTGRNPVPVLKRGF